MSAEIIDFSARLKKKEVPVPPENPTLRELSHFCADCISEDWERAANSNRLSEFFIQSTKPHSNPNSSYLTDLNAISTIETAFGIHVFVRAPDDDEPIGWIAGFKLQGEVFSTIEMFTEQYARCFNVLLFLKLRREMKALGMKK